MEAGPRRVRVDVAGEIVVISWSERDILLKELAFAEGTKSIRERFEVGASGPDRVELDAEQRARLRTALDDWGDDRLQPEGIAHLHAALVRASPEP